MALLKPLALWTFTLAVGSAGGYGFMVLRMPLAWMLGALWITMIFSLAGLPTAVPRPLRDATMMVMGFMIGTGFTPDLLQHLGKWSVSFGFLVLNSAVLTTIIQAYFRHLGGFSRSTALFCSFPGGMTQCMLVGESYGGDPRIISLVHSIRILTVAAVVPFCFQWSMGIAGGGLVRIYTPVNLPDLAIMSLCGIAGAFAGKWLRLPMPIFLGPMLASLLIHITGLTGATSPSLLINGAQVILGCAIGVRFAGIKVMTLLRPMLLAAGASFLMLAVSGLFAWMVFLVTAIPFSSLLLAFSPGGLPEMTVIALSLGTDLALVSSHHITRVIMVAVLTPVIARAFPEWMSPRSP